MSLYRGVLARGLQHVRGCPLCQARGHLCTVCRDDRVIFPFTVRTDAVTFTKFSTSPGTAKRCEGSLTPLIIIRRQGGVYECPECYACYHRRCYDADTGCGRCWRRIMRSQAAEAVS